MMECIGAGRHGQVVLSVVKVWRGLRTCVLPKCVGSSQSPRFFVVVSSLLSRLFGSNRQAPIVGHMLKKRPGVASCEANLLGAGVLINVDSGELSQQLTRKMAEVLRSEWEEGFRAGPQRFTAPCISTSLQNWLPGCSPACQVPANFLTSTN